MEAEVAELIDPRPGEEIDTSRLEPYLRERLPDTAGAFALRQFGGGHANLTYQVRFGAREYVLRRPPLGPVAPSAHDMKREHRVLAALPDVFALAPRSYLYCGDTAILGAEFHVMERRHGMVIRADLPERFKGDRASRGASARCWSIRLPRSTPRTRAPPDWAISGAPRATSSASSRVGPGAGTPPRTRPCRASTT
jgi:aminoglycoside phosphotransferase (APT) family kinase protein